jgi:hypothetical protein
MMSSAERLSDQEPAIPVGSLILPVSDIALEALWPVIVLGSFVGFMLLAKVFLVDMLPPLIWKIHPILRMPIKNRVSGRPVIVNTKNRKIDYRKYKRSGIVERKKDEYRKYKEIGYRSIKKSNPAKLYGKRAFEFGDHCADFNALIIEFFENAFFIKIEFIRRPYNCVRRAGNLLPWPFPVFCGFLRN